MHVLLSSVTVLQQTTAEQLQEASSEWMEMHRWVHRLNGEVQFPMSIGGLVAEEQSSAVEAARD